MLVQHSKLINGVTVINGVSTIANGIHVNGILEAVITPESPRIFGLTKMYFPVSALETVITDINTPYPILVNTVSEGEVSGVTDNNDGSFTNNSSETIAVNGLILIGGGGNSGVPRLAVQAATDNSGSFVLIQSNSGELNSTGAPQEQCWHQYSVLLAPGKTVAPMVQSYTLGAISFYAHSFTHYIWG